MLTIDDHEIRHHGPGNVIGVCWRQWRTERSLARRGINFRTTLEDEVRAAYAAMTAGEFEAINGRQDWANWRTIPRALRGRLPDHPLRVLDLGCGTGGSTRVLAFYGPPGSRITGYDLARPLIEIARRRHYVHRGGRAAAVSFCCQAVTDPLRQPDDTPVPDQSVDLVNASGLIGHHFDAVTVQPLVATLRRLIRPGGLAMLDVGPALGDDVLSGIMARAGFRRLGHWRSWALDATGQVVFDRPPTG